jgi:hypothetical protein
VTRVLWSSAAALLLALIVLAVFYATDPGSPPMLLNPDIPLIHEGVAMVVVCENPPLRETANSAAAVRPRWADERDTQRHRRGDCIVYYHHLGGGD